MLEWQGPFSKIWRVPHPRLNGRRHIGDRLKTRSQVWCWCQLKAVSMSCESVTRPTGTIKPVCVWRAAVQGGKTPPESTRRVSRSASHSPQYCILNRDTEETYRRRLDGPSQFAKMQISLLLRGGKYRALSLPVPDQQRSICCILPLAADTGSLPGTDGTSMQHFRYFELSNRDDGFGICRRLAASKSSTPVFWRPDFSG